MKIDRAWLRNYLGLDAPPSEVRYDVVKETKCDGFIRKLIQYKGDEDDTIPAFLFIPTNAKNCPALLIHHQHAGERHFGKSEVAGIVGDTYQAFGPALAQKGFVVLAPDSICFEDRRIGKSGTEPQEGGADFLEQFNEMSYRLVRGDTLMRKVLSDAERGVTLLGALDETDSSRLGTFGHSYGGNTVIFASATDDRIQFACTSGAACSYAHKMKRATSFEMALTLPNIVKHLDIHDLVAMAAPMPYLAVAGTEDKYAQDASDVCAQARETCKSLGTDNHLEVEICDGPHALDQTRFDLVVEWLGAR